MQDGVDWPVAFLGAMSAEIVPVPVQYAAYRRRSRLYARAFARPGRAGQRRNQAGAESRARKGGSRSPHRRRVAPDSPLEPEEIEFEDFLRGAAPLAKPARTRADDPAFWLYSSGSTGRPRNGAFHANPYWTTELYGKTILGLTESDVCFSAAKLFFAYRTRKRADLPAPVGATALLMAERPTPEAVFRRWLGGVGGVNPPFFTARRPGSPACSLRISCRNARMLSIRLCRRPQALPADIGERFTAPFGVDIVDGIGSTEMLHIFISNRPEKVRYGSTGWPVPGYHIELRGERTALCAPMESQAIFTSTGRRRRSCTGAIAPRRARLSKAAGQKGGDKYTPQFRRDVHLRRPLGRHAEGRRGVWSAPSRSRRRWCSTPPSSKPR